MKTVLKIILGLVIIAFLYFSLNWKTKERRAALAFSGTANREANWLEQETAKTNKNLAASARMASIGAQNLVDPAQDGSEDTQATLLFVTGNYAINAGTFFGCLDKETFLNLVKLTASGDKKTFVKLLSDGVKSGDCIYFEPGEQVTLEETAKNQTEIRVTKFGDNKSYWTVAKAIK